MTANRRLTKKPITINGMPVADLLHCVKANPDGIPDWARKGLEDTIIVPGLHTVTVSTPEGDYTVDHRWWILEGVQGELYPCREDILWESYDLTEGAR